MPERRDGLGFIPGWKVAQVLNDYFAGWEAVHPMATDEEFDVTFAELVGNVVWKLMRLPVRQRAGR